MKHCGECALFLTDTDLDGNPTDFRFCTSDEGFCGMQGLFTTAYQSDIACEEFTPEHKNSTTDC